jgi:REP element-mobilizing transposase RayT
VDDVDRQDFLKTLAEACQKAGWEVHAYCLMRNHFHLVLETPDANLVPGMRWFLSAYTIRLNHRQKLFGHVFSGRYKGIAARLQMGTTKSARPLLHHWMQYHAKQPCTQLQFQPMADPFPVDRICHSHP